MDFIMIPKAFDHSRRLALLDQEEQLFRKTHPKSFALYQRSRKSLHGGVPMLWMMRWAGSFQSLSGKPKERTSPMWMATHTLTFALATPVL
jgi:hypothetical protein